MNMISLLILFLSLGAPGTHTPGLAATPVSVLSTTPSDSSKIKWLDATTHDFGTIPVGKPVSKVFHFKNVSEVPIVIDNVRTTCGCTNTEWDEEPVLPGGEGTITVVFDAVMPKYFRKKVIVWFDGLPRAEHLFVEGVVE
jgi:hypothetical protein